MKKEELAKVIWKYHHMGHTIHESDCIIVLGSHDTRVAERGAQLYIEGLAPWIIFSGGLGRLTDDLWDKPEAEIFAEIAKNIGVPADRIIIENKSTNTGENAAYTKKIIEQKNLNFKNYILVQKPYMERRAYATFKKRWPETDFVVTSPQMTFEEYCNDPDSDISMDEVINIMVGDLQRIMIYPEKGFQIRQYIPDDVKKAYNELIGMGFDRQLIN